jgi:hypothetical protein
MCDFHPYYVPEERLELSHLAIHDFESCASTNSATPALHQKSYVFSAKYPISGLFDDPIDEYGDM